MTSAARSYLSHLECPESGETFNAVQLPPSCLDYHSRLYNWYELLPVIYPVNRLTSSESDQPLLFASHRICQVWIRPGKKFGLIYTGSGLKYV
jgi:hypothetical protein